MQPSPSKNIDEFGNGVTDRTEDIKKMIIQIGLENGLTSQYTSFVGIDHSTGETINDQPTSTREIRNLVGSGFDSDSSRDSDSFQLQNAIISHQSSPASSGNRELSHL